MAASNRLDPRTVIVCRGLLAYAWVPSQEDLHRLWRADELQAGPKHKKNQAAFLGELPRLRRLLATRGGRGREDRRARGRAREQASSRHGLARRREAARQRERGRQDEGAVHVL